MSSTGNEPDGDYSYDMAHDDMSAPAETSARTPTDEAPAAAPTQPDDADGDYSYDLAHEVPQSGPDPAGL
jgi:hypothetical protein